MQVRSLGQEDPLKGVCGNSLQYSCQENPMDRGAWRATVPRDHKELDATGQATEYTHICTRAHTHTCTHRQLNAKNQVNKFKQQYTPKVKMLPLTKNPHPISFTQANACKFLKCKAGSLNTRFELAINNFCKNQNLSYILICVICMIKTVSLIFFFFFLLKLSKSDWVPFN